MSSEPTDYKPLPDAELLVLMKKGDNDAFDEIYNRYWQSLMDQANKMINNPVRNLEIVQDTFNELWAGRERKEILDLYSYLEMRLRYKVVKMGRRISDNNLPELEVYENMSLAALQRDSSLNERELKGCISLWMAMNSGQGSDIFTMRFLEDASIAKICFLLDLSEKSVKDQLLQTYNKLRAFLRKMMPILIVGSVS